MVDRRRVRMKSTSAGPDGVVHAGAIVEVSVHTAHELVSGGYAEYADRPVKPSVPVPESPVEVAAETRGAPESTARRRGR